MLTNNAVTVVPATTGKKLISKKAVLSVLGNISAPTLWRMGKNDNFPLPVRVSRNRVAWLENEVNDWIASRASERAA